MDFISDSRRSCCQPDTLFVLVCALAVPCARSVISLLVLSLSVTASWASPVCSPHPLAERLRYAQTGLLHFRTSPSCAGHYGRSGYVAPDQVEAEFKLIDTNGGGIVLFDEFADWAIKKELDLEDDDDFDDGTEIRFVSAAEGAGHARTGRSTGRPQSSRGRSTSSSRSPSTRKASRSYERAQLRHRSKERQWRWRCHA